jgi:thiol:disulfide interchange protein DsbD
MKKEGDCMFRSRARRTDCTRGALAALFLALLLLPSSDRGQGIVFPPGGLVTANMTHSLSVFHAGSTGYVAITAEVADGWHLNSNAPLETYLIPTVLDVRAPAGVEVVRILYPEPLLRKLQISEGKMSLYDGVVNFGAIVRIVSGVAPGSYPVAATLRYQGCNDFTCVEPTNLTVEDTLRVGTPDEAVEQLAPEIFSKPPFVDGTGQPVAVASAESGGGFNFRNLIAERGLALTFIFIFFFGLALNLTPCIYPLIPITISYFGGQGGGKTSRVFLLALLYVFGMSITYSVLGTIAAMTGSLFGSALQNPIVVIFVAAVFVVLALSMFGFWEIRMPLFLARRTGTARRGYAGAVVMGLTMGIVAAPCIGPVVLGLLTYVGEMGKPLLGFLMFFTLSWGIGVPFLILGTLSGSIGKLPRSGEWMVWVRKIFGFILIGMAFYFMRHFLGPRIVSIGYGAVAAIAGIYLGWVDKSAGTGRGVKMMRHAVGIAGIVIAALFVMLPMARKGPGEGVRGIVWQPFSSEAVAQAAREGKPVIVDFSAAWCYYCHELDVKTFSNAEVVGLSSKFVPLRIDLTRSGPVETEIKNSFAVRGLPAIIFIDKTGAEIKNLRAAGFIDAAEFKRRIETLTGATPGR